MLKTEHRTKAYQNSNKSATNGTVWSGGSITHCHLVLKLTEMLKQRDSTITKMCSTSLTRPSVSTNATATSVSHEAALQTRSSDEALGDRYCGKIFNLSLHNRIKPSSIVAQQGAAASTWRKLAEHACPPGPTWRSGCGTGCPMPTGLAVQTAAELKGVLIHFEDLSIMAG